MKRRIEAAAGQDQFGGFSLIVAEVIGPHVSSRIEEANSSSRHETLACASLRQPHQVFDLEVMVELQGLLRVQTSRLFAGEQVRHVLSGCFCWLERRDTLGGRSSGNEIDNFVVRPNLGGHRTAPSPCTRNSRRSHSWKQFTASDGAIAAQLAVRRNQFESRKKSAGHWVRQSPDVTPTEVLGGRIAWRLSSAGLSVWRIARP